MWHCKLLFIGGIEVWVKYTKCHWCDAVNDFEFFWSHILKVPSLTAIFEREGPKLQEMGISDPKCTIQTLVKNGTFGVILFFAPGKDPWPNVHAYDMFGLQTHPLKRPIQQQQLYWGCRMSISVTRHLTYTILYIWCSPRRRHSIRTAQTQPQT